jgi:hypothetical protein
VAGSQSICFSGAEILSCSSQWLWCDILLLFVDFSFKAMPCSMGRVVAVYGLFVLSSCASIVDHDVVLKSATTAENSLSLNSTTMHCLLQFWCIQECKEPSLQQS